MANYINNKILNMISLIINLTIIKEILAFQSLIIIFESNQVTIQQTLFNMGDRFFWLYTPFNYINKHTI